MSWARHAPSNKPSTLQGDPWSQTSLDGVVNGFTQPIPGEKQFKRTCVPTATSSIVKTFRLYKASDSEYYSYNISFCYLRRPTGDKYDRSRPFSDETYCAKTLLRPVSTRSGQYSFVCRSQWPNHFDSPFN